MNTLTFCSEVHLHLKSAEKECARCIKHVAAFQGLMTACFSLLSIPWWVQEQNLSDIGDWLNAEFIDFSDDRGGILPLITPMLILKMKECSLWFLDKRNLK